MRAKQALWNYDDFYMPDVILQIPLWFGAEAGKRTKRNTLGARKMVQSVKYLLHKHAFGSLAPEFL